ncbi:NACHT, LRR and PYD domains-containing protein 3-like [Xenia sp. Carnegie-2017]|uniref:NACHT, LRR and PYD domains-containing protein 3-like n=1 Tax=Xenia sp. Carnegie-2017 TaxID=2897299 RepID=UPI001F03C26B|nr:NACHT, LRR and PYD domains-containing protein 3-like [Xenia sp. Carnegie-2017]
MEKYLDYIPQTSFNLFGRLLLYLFGVSGAISFVISSYLSAKTSFHCYNDFTARKKQPALIHYIESNCWIKYEKTQTLSLFMSVLINFGVVFVLSIIYGYLVEYHNRKIDQPNTTGYQNKDRRTSPTNHIQGDTSNLQDNRSSPQVRRRFVHGSGESAPSIRNEFPSTSCSSNITESFVIQLNEDSQLSPSEKTPQSACVKKSTSTFFIYIAYLVTRLVFLSVFVAILHPIKYPIDFSCSFYSKVMKRFLSNEDIDCINLNGGKSERLILFIVIADVIVISLTLLELCYLAYVNYIDRSFKTEFRSVYLLGKRKRFLKWLNKIKNDFHTYKVFEIHDDFGDDQNSWRNLDDIYVNVIVQAERQLKNAYPNTFRRNEIFHCHLESHSDATHLTKATEIFKVTQKKEDQSYPRSLLIIGRPGIGKTMLTKKLVHEWKSSVDENVKNITDECEEHYLLQDKLVLLMRCRTFKKGDITLKEMLGDCVGFSDKQFPKIYDFILLNPGNVVLIFDGFDELPLDSQNLRTDGSICADAEMPVFTLVCMLVEGKLLPGVTVLITSRPTAEYAFNCIKFERTVEILGFFKNQIEEYVERFCGENKSTAELILNCIDSSLELRSFCYIPVNTYIVCLTLKECYINDAKDIPKTITELYKRAVKILLWRHHPRCKDGSIRKPIRGYLVKDLPKELENDVQKMKSLAKKGIEERKLIFEEPSFGDFHDYVNCGLLHKIPDKRRDLYCFLHLTLQEFLAAWCIVDDWQNLGKFLDDHVADPKWHLVVEFVAGLVGSMKREQKKRKMREFQSRLEKWVTCLTRCESDQTLGFLGVKCLYELQDRDALMSACTNIWSNSGVIFMPGVSFTPVDSSAIFDFLSECEHITELQFSDCKMLDNHSCLRMKKFLSSMTACNVLSLKLHSCSVNHNFSKYLSEALISENCKLTRLVISSCQLEDEGAAFLSKSLKSVDCKLTELDISDNRLADKGVIHLSEALESENCKLTVLNLSDNKPTEKGIHRLSEALESENCKLTELYIEKNELAALGALCVSRALRSKNCKLTKLYICGNRLTDGGAVHLKEALRSESCKTSVLYICDNKLTDLSAQYFSEALKSGTCKLTELNISSNKLTQKGAKYISEALTSENCNLMKLNMSKNNLGNVGAKHLHEALTSDTCKLTELNIKYNNIADKNAKDLSDALKTENRKHTKMNIRSNKLAEYSAKSRNEVRSALKLSGKYNSSRNVGY